MTSCKNFLLCSLILIWGGTISAQGPALQNNRECRILSMIPFSDARSNPTGIDGDDPDMSYYGHGEWPNAETLAQAAFSLMASAELARLHFNARDDSLVPALAHLECDVVLAETQYIDSAYHRSTALDELWEMNALMPGTYCGLVGPSDVKSVTGISTIAQITHIPQIIYRPQDSRSSGRDNFPNLVSLRSTSNDFADAVTQYLYRGDVGIHREYGAIVYDSDEYGEQFENPLNEHESVYQYQATKANVQKGREASYYETLGSVQYNGYRTILVITERPSILYTLARVASELGLLGEGYLWVLIGETISLELLHSMQYEVDSPVDKLLRGAAVFTNFDPFVYFGEDYPFLKVWRNQNASMVEHLNALQPMNDQNLSYFEADTMYFESHTPTPYASLIYDAVIAMGLSACEAARLDGSHVDELLKTNFQGASGQVNFDHSDEEYSNFRDHNGVFYGVYNVRPKAEIDAKTNKRGYEAVLTAVYSHFDRDDIEDGEYDGKWIPVEDKEFLYFDGTPNEPMPHRTVQNAHYLSDAVQMTGFVLSAFAVLLSIITAVWVYWNHNNASVKASQPEFLYLLCFGSALIAPSTYFLGFDEQHGLTEEQLSVLCSFAPWTFMLGFVIMYCAIFSKLWRLSKVLTMRRRAVGVWHVLVPFAIIIASSLTVLLVWQLISPLVWERRVISIDPLETYGQCTSLEHGLAPFVIPLGVIIFVTMSITAAFCWKLRAVQSELSESRWIFAGIFVHMQTWLVGLPILYITDSVSKDAFYLMIVAFTFTFSTTMVALVIWPKIFTLAKEKGICMCDKPRNTRISVLGGRNTIISGLPSSSCVQASFSKESARIDAQLTSIPSRQSEGQMIAPEQDESARIEELERMVEQLQRQLMDCSEQDPCPTKASLNNPLETWNDERVGAVNV